ncbi:MAG: hypothetical protein QNJ51_20645 [Calothrix sp. MO_167.B12]|nr:hypothetical protein [Calothrix sp. MO_167.B12]
MQEFDQELRGRKPLNSICGDKPVGQFLACNFLVKYESTRLAQAEIRRYCHTKLRRKAMLAAKE